MNNNRCVCCGAIIPEGYQVCKSCDSMVKYDGITVKELRVPTEKQILLAADIAYTLGIDFPQSSTDFTARNYWAFIKDNIDEARRCWQEIRDDEARGGGFYDDMMYFSPINQ